MQYYDLHYTSAEPKYCKGEIYCLALQWLYFQNRILVNLLERHLALQINITNSPGIFFSLPPMFVVYLFVSSVFCQIVCLDKSGCSFCFKITTQKLSLNKSKDGVFHFSECCLCSLKKAFGLSKLYCSAALLSQQSSDFICHCIHDQEDQTGQV